MPSLKKFTPQTESELHLIIQKELDALEDGLVVLQHEYTSTKGTIDFLCVDSGGRLVIIEVKLHEDENVLFQALRYYDAVDKDRFLVAGAFKGSKIDPTESPRIVIIAEAFTEDLKRLTTLVVPDIELFEYTVVVTSAGEKGIVFHPVSLPAAERRVAEPKTVEKLIDYLREDRLKPALGNMRNAIKNLGKGIEEYATQGYIGYKHGGRQFAYIKVYRTSLEIGAHLIDEKRQLLGYDGMRVESPTEDYSPTLEKIKAAFVALGGQLA
jgi:hypothetical protein